MEAARQHQREKLRLVAELGEGNEPERDQKSFHVTVVLHHAAPVVGLFPLRRPGAGGCRHQHTPA
jgi:hypothetical protein